MLNLNFVVCQVYFDTVLAEIFKKTKVYFAIALYEVRVLLIFVAVKFKSNFNTCSYTSHERAGYTG